MEFDWWNTIQTRKHEQAIKIYLKPFSPTWENSKGNISFSSILTSSYRKTSQSFIWASITDPVFLTLLSVRIFALKV